MSFRSKSVDRLFQTFLNLETIDECYAYFEDLCTIKELLDIYNKTKIYEEYVVSIYEIIKKTKNINIPRIPWLTI